MQLTRIDRWLRERFVYETHVYTLRPPEEVPSGIVGEQLEESPGRNYRFRYVARKPEAAEQLISFLKQHNQMFATRVVDRSAWYVPFIAPKDRSVTYWIVWTVLSVVIVLLATKGVTLLWQNDEFRTNVLDAVKVLGK